MRLFLSFVLSFVRRTSQKSFAEKNDEVSSFPVGRVKGLTRGFVDSQVSSTTPMRLSAHIREATPNWFRLDMTHSFVPRFARNLIIFTLVIALVFADEAADEEKDSLKCIVNYLKEKGVNEDFFSSIGDRTGAADCEFLINVRLTRAYGKIHDKLKVMKY